MQAQQIDKEQLADELAHWLINGGEGPVDRTTKIYQVARRGIMEIVKQMDRLRKKRETEPSHR